MDREQEESEKQTGNWNLALKTMGGKQLWTDHFLFRDYRIQHHAVTDHYRLLDPADIRRAWGTFEECKNKFDQIRQEQQLKPVTGHVIILLHGLTRSRSSMASMAKHLSKNADVTITNFGYASTRASVADHARALDNTIRQLPDVEKISFVCHSMGNLVVRYYLGKHVKNQKSSKPRFHRMVMLGPPNNGSGFATYLQNNLIFKTVCGTSGQELSTDWKELNDKLATPSFEFGIIAGGQEDGAWLNNRILDGKDDFIVSVEETKLPGAADFLVKPLIHGTMMNNTDVQKATFSFLQHGYFVSEKEMKPINK